MLGFGIDIGGTGMKAAPVDLSTGELAAPRFRIDTPKPSTPENMAIIAKALVDHHEWAGPVGICMPTVVSHGIVHSAANIDKSWIDVDADKLFTEAVGAPVSVTNDADAAGAAEMTWGVGKGRQGVVICLTFGTGIGSGMFVDGVLVPNTELGHLELNGYDAELKAAASARVRDDISWKEWADRVDRYLKHVVMLFSPELLILGGGASKTPDKWVDRLDPGCEVQVAAMANNAGIAGAAQLSPTAT
jgi:polyphosphate glucokinase